MLTLLFALHSDFHKLVSQAHPFHTVSLHPLCSVEKALKGRADSVPHKERSVSPS